MRCAYPHFNPSVLYLFISSLVSNTNNFFMKFLAAIKYSIDQSRSSSKIHRFVVSLFVSYDLLF